MAKNLTEGNPLKLIISFALPVLAGNLFQQAYNLVDAALVGRYLGSDALASVGATSSVQFLVMGFCIGICLGFAIPVAQQYGAKNIKKMKEFIFHGGYLCVVFALILTVLCGFLCPMILDVLKTPEKLYKDAYDYLFVLFMGIPFSLLYNYLAGLLRAVGDSRTPFIFLVISTVLNIGLDVLFIVVFGWGCAGAAIATVVAQAVSGILCLGLILFRYELLRIHRDDCRIHARETGTMLLMGVPMGLQFSITAIGSMVMQAANNGLKNPAYISAFAACAKIKQFGMCPFDAVASAVANFCSQNYGAGRFDRIRDGLKKGLFLAVSYGILIGIVFIFFGAELSMIFVKKSEVSVISASGLYMRCAGFFFFLLGFLNVCRLTIQGLGYAMVAIIAGVLEMIARVAVSLTAVPKFGFLAICFTDQAAWLVATLFVVPLCFYLIQKKAKQTI